MKIRVKAALVGEPGHQLVTCHLCGEYTELVQLAQDEASRLRKIVERIVRRERELERFEETLSEYLRIKYEAQRRKIDETYGSWSRDTDMVLQSIYTEIEFLERIENLFRTRGHWDIVRAFDSSWNPSRDKVKEFRADQIQNFLDRPRMTLKTDQITEALAIRQFLKISKGDFGKQRDLLRDQLAFLKRKLADKIRIVEKAEKREYFQALHARRQEAMKEKKEEAIKKHDAASSDFFMCAQTGCEGCVWLNCRCLLRKSEASGHKCALGEIEDL